MADLVQRLHFDATRCELQFSKGVATNIEEAAAEIVSLGLTIEGQAEQIKIAAAEIKRLLTAHRRIASLAEKNVPKYAQQIAREAIGIHQQTERRVGDYVADYSPLSTEEIQQPTGAEDLLANSKPVNRRD